MASSHILFRSCLLVGGLVYVSARIGTKSQSEWWWDSDEENECSKMVAGATPKNFGSYPDCKCAEYSDKVACGDEKIKIAGRKFDVTEVLSRCETKPFCTHIPAALSSDRTCDDIAGATSRNSEAYPQCKCDADNEVVFCRTDNIAERKFDASQALELCVEPYCARCVSCEVTDPMLKMLYTAIKPVAEGPLKELGVEWKEIEPYLEHIDSLNEVKGALKSPKLFIEQVVKDFAVDRLEPAATPWLQKLNVTWTEALPVLKTLDAETLKKAWQDPGPVLQQVAETSGPFAWTLALGKLKPAVAPWLEEHDMQWDDVLPLLRSVPSVDELAKGLSDPAAFMDELTLTSAPLAWEIVSNELQQTLQPWLEEQGLTWADVEPVLQRSLSVDQLRFGLASIKEDPSEFMSQMASQSGALAWKMGMIKLEPLVTPWLEERNLTWEVVAPLLAEVDSVEELQEAAKNPYTFMDKFANSSRTLAFILVEGKFQVLVEPWLFEHGLVWGDLVPYIENATYTSFADLEGALEDPNAFLEALAPKCGEWAWIMAVHHLKPKLTPWLNKKNLTWEEAQDALLYVESLDKLKQAIDDPVKLMEELILQNGPFAWKIAKNELRPLVGDWLKNHSLEWSDVEPALSHMNDLASLQKAVLNPTEFMEELAGSSMLMMWSLAKAELKPKLQGFLTEYNLTWSEVSAVLANARNLDELRSVVGNSTRAVELAKKLAVQSGLISGLTDTLHVDESITSRPAPTPAPPQEPAAEATALPTPASSPADEDSGSGFTPDSGSAPGNGASSTSRSSSTSGSESGSASPEQTTDVATTTGEEPEGAGHSSSGAGVVDPSLPSVDSSLSHDEAAGNGTKSGAVKSGSACLVFMMGLLSAQLFA